MSVLDLEFAYSSCPNDTYAFHAMTYSLVGNQNYNFNPYIADIEELNRHGFSGRFPVTKLSFYAYLVLNDQYTLCESGAALGFGCGPLLVAGNNFKCTPDARIAVPGDYTTALLMLKLWNPSLTNVKQLRFDQIMPAVASGEFDAGLIIHEGRFVYPQYGLKKIVDLGEWWESETSLPIPLGCICVRRDLGKVVLRDINFLLKASIEYANLYPDASKEYVKENAREMDQEVINQHIKLYVNDFSINLGDVGHRAVEELRKRAVDLGVI